MNIINIAKFGFYIALLSACHSTSSSGEHKQVNSIQQQGFDLNNREAISLPAALEEVSGHTFLPAKEDVLYAIQDENGIVYAFNLKTKQIEDTIPFGPDGDYEGITTDGTNFYVLKSNGDIYSFPVQGTPNIADVKVFKNTFGKGEYESLGIDTVRKELVVLCKSCKDDRKKAQSTGYLLKYDQNGDITVDRPFIVDLAAAKSLDSKFPKVFNPSAITKKHSSDEWYILSSIDKLLLITDANFQPKAVLPFSRKHYEQPEGIAFDSKENLYISSERGGESSGMIYKIK